jgi:hypothetical protein
MSSLETPIPVKATRRTTRGPRATWSTGPKPASPRKPFWTPHGSNLSMSLCRGHYNTRTWTQAADSGVKLQPRNAHRNQAPKYYGRWFVHSREPRVGT